jgi:pseudouridine-5'-phosphate glycosidase
VEQKVDMGSAPATIALLDGNIRVRISGAELIRLAESKSALSYGKISKTRTTVNGYK